MEGLEELRKEIIKNMESLEKMKWDLKELETPEELKDEIMKMNFDL